MAGTITFGLMPGSKPDSLALTRRGLLGSALAAGPVAAKPGRDWAQIAAQDDVTGEVIQLENGNWGMMARPVLAAYERHLRRVNRETSFYSRRGYGADLDRVRARAAASLGVFPDEIAFTRGATEALQALIGGYNRLRPGDCVLYSDHDWVYPRKGPKRDIGFEANGRRLGRCRHTDFQDQTCRCCEINERIQ